MIKPEYIWKKQHYSQSCYSACLGMLLQNRDIEIDDVQISSIVLTPVLIELDKNKNTYLTSFRAYQEDIQFNICSLFSLSYEMKNNLSLGYNEYLNLINHNLANNNPVIVGVMSDKLPDFHFFYNQKGERHAIVIYGVQDHEFYCLNPATICCLRSCEEAYDAVKYQVHFTMTESQLLDASIDLQVSYINDTLNPNSNSFDFLSLSIQSLENISNNARSWLGNHSQLCINNTDLLRGFYTKFIEPFAPYMKSVINNEFNNQNIYQNAAKILDVLEKDFLLNEPDLNYMNSNPQNINKACSILSKFEIAMLDALKALQSNKLP